MVWPGPAAGYDLGKQKERFTEMARYRLKALRQEHQQFVVNLFCHYLERLDRHRRMIENDLSDINTLMRENPYLTEYYTREGLRKVVDNTIARKPGRYRPEPLDAA